VYGRLYSIMKIKNSILPPLLHSMKIIRNIFSFDIGTFRDQELIVFKINEISLDIIPRVYNRIIILIIKICRLYISITLITVHLYPLSCANVYYITYLFLSLFLISIMVSCVTCAMNLKRSKIGYYYLFIV
jgi:hypothetical protein